MSIDLDLEQKKILQKILVGDRATAWICGVENESLSLDEIEAICDALSGEYNMEGIESDFEPNEYGKKIMALLNIVNRPRVQT